MGYGGGGGGGEGLRFFGVHRVFWGNIEGDQLLLTEYKRGL